MKLVVFGLEGGLASPVGNETAGVWRGIGRALAHRGHRLAFFQSATTYQETHYALADVAGIDVRLYAEWEDVRQVAAKELEDADVGIVTSSSPDCREAGELLLASRATLHCFYDVDTPATLAAGAGTIGERGLRDYDLVLARMGGPALTSLGRVLGARLTAPLYPCFDPDFCAGLGAATAAPTHALSYLDPYAKDRLHALEALLLAPARLRPGLSFLVGGGGYPDDFGGAGAAANVRLAGHVAPADRGAFYATAAATLHIARLSHATLGFCPSARMFEAAAYGAALLSDGWDGLERFLTPGEEILVARDADDVLDAIERPLGELRAIGKRARERTFDEHTAGNRAEELERLLGACARRAWSYPAMGRLAEQAQS